MTDIKSLSHSKWGDKHYIVFAPKYRRLEIYGKIKADIGVIIRKLYEQKEVEKLLKHRHAQIIFVCLKKGAPYF